MVQFNYKPDGSTLKSFLKADDFFRGIRGPVGSGKSVACCVEVFKRAIQQEKGKDGIRKSRWAVIRNTNPQLKTTTIKTWLDWFPENTFGNFAWSVPYTHRIKVADIDLEVIFLALDRPEDVKKLLSLELTGVWVNEARELPKSIIDACTMRVGRYPSMRDGGPSWYGVIADTNAPEEDHWWSIMSGEVPTPEHLSREEALMLVKPDDWSFYIQPSAMLEKKNTKGELEGYDNNPKCENQGNLTESYYPNIIKGKTKGWIDVYVMNKLGTIEEGKPVYPSWNKGVHISKEPLEPFSTTLFVGIDFGLTPAAVFGQKLADGRWLILHELVCFDMGIVRFTELLKTEMAKKFRGLEIEIYGDPAGDFRVQTDERTPFQILRQQGLRAKPAPSNDVALRIESVEAALTRMVEGKAGFLVNNSCMNLKKGFNGGYYYRRIQVSGDRYDDKPMKNRYSHVHDALQYLMLGAGEGRSLMAGKTAPSRVIQTRSWNIFDNQKKKKKSVWQNRLGI